MWQIIEFLELEETFKGHLVQLPCNEQGQLWLRQVAQSPLFYPCSITTDPTEKSVLFFPVAPL